MSQAITRKDIKLRLAKLYDLMVMCEKQNKQSELKLYGMEVRMLVKQERRTAK